MPNPPVPQAAMFNSMNAVRLTQARVINMQRMVTVTTPQFAQDQVDAMHKDPATVVHTIDQKTWVTLAGWLDPANAVVQCRGTGLTVKVNRKDKMTAALLPISDGFPKATLRFTVAGADSAPQKSERKLETHLNIDGGSLLLDMAFKANTYDEVFTAMTAPGSDIRVEIEFAHPYQVQVHVPAPKPAQPPPQPHPPVPTPRPPAPPPHPVQTHPPAPPPRPRVVVKTAVVMPKVQPAKPVVKMGRATPPPAPKPAPKPVPVKKIQTPPPHWIVVPPPPPASDTITYRDEILSGQKISIPIAHTQTETDVFPDLRLHTQTGWGQVPEHRKLLYLDSPRADTFFYLPTTFKLGCYSDVAAGPAGSRLPLQVELYPGPDGNERIKATLIALPCVEDQEREDLRTHLCQDVLQRQQPFVNLEMKSGLQASFIADFTAGTATGQQSLPSNIAFQAVEVVPDQRLVLRFDMPAESYSIFCEILKFGIFGKVKLSDPGKSMEAEIDVRLQLQDLVTNQLQVQQIPPDVPTAAPSGPADAPAPAAPAGTLKLQNLLDFPVIPSSVKVHYLNVANTSHLVFEAETATVTLPDGQLPAQSDPNSTLTFPTKPQQLLAWDATVVETGQLKVQGGAPQDWLDRVNRDPSLQPREIQLQLEPVISSAIRDRVQLMRLHLFKDGDPKVRNSLELTPSSPAPKLKIPVSMAELAVEGGQRNFSVEYETVASDGSISLPQRVAIDPDATNLPIQAIVETPKSIFTVEYDGDAGVTRKELDRKAAADLMDDLRSKGGHWRFSVKEPEATTTPTSTTTGTTTSATTTTTPTTGSSDSSAPTTTTNTPATTPAKPSGPDVTVVTDLAAIALQDGTLLRIFVVLKPPTDDVGQQSSFVLDAKNFATFNWHPEGFVVPPFRYEISYFYKGNQVKKSSGTSSNLALILDPPPLS